MQPKEPIEQEALAPGPHDNTAASKFSKATIQLLVVLIMVILWSVGLVVAQFDGSTMLKVMTPFMTMTIGWLFTQKATGD